MLLLLTMNIIKRFFIIIACLYGQVVCGQVPLDTLYINTVEGTIFKAQYFPVALLTSTVKAEPTNRTTHEGELSHLNTFFFGKAYNKLIRGVIYSPTLHTKTDLESIIVIRHLVLDEASSATKVFKQIKKRIKHFYKVMPEEHNFLIRIDNELLLCSTLFVTETDDCFSHLITQYRQMGAVVYYN